VYYWSKIIKKSCKKYSFSLFQFLFFELDSCAVTRGLRHQFGCVVKSVPTLDVTMTCFAIILFGIIPQSNTPFVCGEFLLFHFFGICGKFPISPFMVPFSTPHCSVRLKSRIQCPSRRAISCRYNLHFSCK